MATTAQSKATVMNVPNQLSVARLVLALVVFTLIGLQWYFLAVLMFLLAAGTDWVDGWWARRYGQVTKLGRMLDPFVDKIIICGTFFFLAGQAHLLERSAALGFGVHAWIATLVVGREMLVTALRSFIEQSGGDFSAKTAGKWKMVFQCAAVVANLLALMYVTNSVPLWLPQTEPAWLAWGLLLSVWLAVIFTVYSGLEYIVAAVRFVRS
jgi:CDP-diacylglycerol---glycerol-3-phosphate 3-phosphatidyltransferase